jgi:phosphoribosylanthranilate isomerase
VALWIKICGLTTKEAVDAAVAARVSAIGFVFAPSRRRVTAQRASELCVDVPSTIQRVAVMQHPGQSLVDEVWEHFRPDILQTDVEDLVQLRLPEQLRTLPVLRVGADIRQPLPARVLCEGAVSGTGIVSDWTHAARLARRTQVVVAGGLTPMNVSAAIVAVDPFGVDVSSGVEDSPGHKDPAKIRAFVAAARAALQERTSA